MSYRKQNTPTGSSPPLTKWAKCLHCLCVKWEPYAYKNVIFSFASEPLSNKVQWMSNGKACLKSKFPFSLVLMHQLPQNWPQYFLLTQYHDHYESVSSLAPRILMWFSIRFFYFFLAAQEPTSATHGSASPKGSFCHTLFLCFPLADFFFQTCISDKKCCCRALWCDSWNSSEALLKADSRFSAQLLIYTFLQLRLLSFLLVARDKREREN